MITIKMMMLFRMIRNLIVIDDSDHYFGYDVVMSSLILQYYTGINGNASSFNFKLTDNIFGSDMSTHLANQEYSICVRLFSLLPPYMG
jgi:hypothetical protein